MSTKPSGDENGGPPIVVERYFDADRETIFRSWTDPEMVVKWFGHSPNSLHSASIDLRLGGAWQFAETQDAEKLVAFEGEYLEIQPEERLVFTWVRVIVHASGKREESLHAEIDIAFSRSGSGTKVRLIHTPKRSQDSKAGIGDGWNTALSALGEHAMAFRDRI